MKANFLRHEYTWSKKSIGGTVGLGIVSSSTPKEKEALREIEKMASMAEADSETGMEVELLMYNPVVGTIKMAVKPAPAGEDQRKNKKVFLYQCEEENASDPDIYCIPKGSWESQGDTYLSPITLEEKWDTGRNILVKYHFMDRLPDLFRAVFWCIFRGSQHLAFVASWNREEYALFSREIMYAIHKIIPEACRKNAGYASYGCGMNQCSSFYFTDTIPEGDYFDVDGLEYHRKNMREDKLDQFFYDTLARIFWESEPLYYEFFSWVNEGIGEREIDKSILKEMEWMFLQFCLDHQIDIPSSEDILSLLPQLFYGASDSSILSEIQDNLLYYYHSEEWNREKYVAYLNILENGITKKGEDKILEEMEWVLNEYKKEHKGVVKDYLNNLKKGNPLLFTKLLSRNYKEEDGVFHDYFENSKLSLSKMKNCLHELVPSVIQEGIKDAWMLRGIEILNEDVFCVDHFKIFTDIAQILNRKKQWTEILNGFLNQLRKECENLTDEQLDAACEIESIYTKVTEGPVEEGLYREKQSRNHDTEEEDSEERWINKREEEDAMEEEVFRTLEEEREEKFLSFFVSGIPYGFLTGCILYLLNYALVIGHWKISIGVAGMWLILMMNYANERLRIPNGYRMWKALGLCIVEGYIIQVIAWVFLPQNIRVYFFLIVGILTVLIQLIHMIILKRNATEKEENV